jgi:hypothetical protein
VRPKHLLEALDEATSRTATKVNRLELRQLCGIEDVLQDMTIEIWIKSLSQQQLEIRTQTIRMYLL